VGWINSNVKLEEHRERLFDLAVENARLGKIIGKDEMKNLTKIYQSLVRDFSN
jgi:predicted 2-oxoglutarate/Fe(II)-dependent dioxygenase YbiX